MTRARKDYGGVAASGFGAALLLSRIYDLEPENLSERSNYVRLTGQSEISALSPIRNAGPMTCPVTIGFGSLGTPECQMQLHAFADALSSSSQEVSVVGADFYNHFEQLETLGDPYGVFGRIALNSIRSAS